MKSGTMFFITGLIHNSIIFIIPQRRNVILSMIKNGWINSISNENSNIFWSLVAGILMMFSGRLMQYQNKIPNEIGYWLIIIGIIGGLAFPISGFWLVLIQGLYILSKNKNKKNYLK